jgi:hypothetical protein
MTKKWKFELNQELLDEMFCEAVVKAEARRDAAEQTPKLAEIARTLRCHSEQAPRRSRSFCTPLHDGRR